MGKRDSDLQYAWNLKLSITDRPTGVTAIESKKRKIKVTGLGRQMGRTVAENTNGA